MVQGPSPQDIATRIRVIRDAYLEKYMATLDQYASKSGPRNSPGQLSLFNGGQPLRSSKTQQKFRWITVHPPGHEKGQPVLIDDKGTVQGGMGGKFTGKKIGELGKSGKNDTSNADGAPKPEGKPKEPEKQPRDQPGKQPSNDHRTSAIAKALDFIKRTGHVTTGAQAEMQAGNAWFTLNEDQRGAFSGHKEFARAVGKAFVGRTEPEGAGDEPAAGDPPVEDAPKPESSPAPKTTPSPSPDATPRERAKAESEAQDSDYEFARKSAIPNAGEDLKGSARHTRNAWRSLEEAEADGSAEAMVTRDNLLKNEPHELGLHVDKSPITTLLMHQALKSFPPAPGYRKGRRDDEAAKKDRSDYLDAYRNIKKAAETIAASGIDDPREASQKLGRAVSEEIRRLREADRYSNTGNALVNLANSLTQTYRKSALVRKVGEFALELKAQVQGPDGSRERLMDSIHRPEAMRERVIDAVHDVLEGKSFSQVLGKTGKAREKGFSAADLYVATAEREGGPKIPAKTAKESLDYLVDKVGLRGVQFGNSVSDGEREHHAKMAAGAMVDLASVLGVPVDAVSLDGSLGLAMGARGRGGALAHYEPTSKVINLTRKKGVGSLAHEWAHAMDHHLGGGELETSIRRGRFEKSASYMSETAEVSYTGRREGDKWVSTKIDNTQKPVYKEMFALQKAMKDSGFDARLKKAIRSKGLGKKAKYWQSNVEKFARCFERYVQRKLEKEGRKNTYLAGVDSAAYTDTGLWPTDTEIDAMAPAFESLMDAYRKERLKMDEPVKYSAAEREFWVDRLAANLLDRESRVAELRQVYLDRYTATLEARVDRYRVGKEKSKPKKSEPPKMTTGTFGQRGRFVTLDDGRVIFITSDNTVERGPKEMRGTKVDSSRIKERTRAPGNKAAQPFVPKSKLDHAIVEVVGRDPVNVRQFREIVDQMHNLAMDEWSEEVDALRNVLGPSRDIGGFISKIKRSQSDAASVKNFDELVDHVKREYPQLLGRQAGSSDKGGEDSEGALWDRLKRGFSQRPAKHSPKVIEMATEMWDNLTASVGDSEPNDDEGRVLIDPSDPFSDYVPFAASFTQQVIERYHAGIA